jgi:hypothetical protein
MLDERRAYYVDAKSTTHSNQQTRKWSMKAGHHVYPPLYGESRIFIANVDNFRLGLSTLHAWIRCFECLLHISYRLEVKKWQLRDAILKENVKNRSKNIQQLFKIKMGLIVDKPKPGYGNSNDGNTARKFFLNPELSAEITGLDITLIKKFGIILRALSSDYDINIRKFRNFAEETRKLYLQLYSWYYMSATVHKILIHSTDIVQWALIPIGQLSEEAQEARNKDCRRYREYNTRKQSRIDTNIDLLHMLHMPKLGPSSLERFLAQTGRF